MPETTIVTPTVQVPSAQEMSDQVSQVLQAEKINSPNPQINQPIRNAQSTPQLPANNGIALANTPETSEPEIETKIQVIDSIVKAKKWAVKGVGILLTLQGLHGIYKSVIFILVEYPMLEQQLISHQVTQHQVNDFGIKAIMMVISTVLSMFFAMKLTFLKSKAAKTLSTTIGILLFIGNALIHDYFVSLNSSQIMVDYIIAFIDMVRGAPEKVIEQSPYLEKTIEGSIDTVWYK